MPEIIIVGFGVFLYSVFVLAKDDFMLLRKNVSLEEVFNISCVCFLIVLFFARLVFVLENPHAMYFNPLVFVAFPYFPGLSLSGGIAGGVLYLWYYSSKRKLLQKRLWDIFGISFVAALATSNVILSIVTFFSKKTINIVSIGILIVLYAILFVLLRFSAKSKLKDGSVGYIAIAGVCCVFVLSRALQRGAEYYFRGSLEDILFFIIIAGFSVFLFRNERKIK